MLTRWTCYRQGTQHDPELLSAEPEYAPAKLRQIGETMAAMCARFAPHCYALDAWQLTFGRPSDSEDGRVSAASRVDNWLRMHWLSVSLAVDSISTTIRRR